MLVLLEGEKCGGVMVGGGGRSNIAYITCMVLYI